MVTRFEPFSEDEIWAINEAVIQTNTRNLSLYVKIWFFFVHVEEKNYFYEEPKTRQPALRDMLSHFHALSSDRT